MGTVVWITTATCPLQIIAVYPFCRLTISLLGQMYATTFQSGTTAILGNFVESQNSFPTFRREPRSIAAGGAAR